MRLTHSAEVVSLGRVSSTDATPTIGAVIREQRDALKVLDGVWTQAHVAAKVNALTGSKLSGSDISRWEADRHRPSNENLAALAQVFGVPLSTFFGEATTEPPESRLDRVERKIDALLAAIGPLLKEGAEALADAQTEPPPKPRRQATRRGQRRAAAP